MSIASDCGACMAGNHEQHDRDHGIRPGVIGGAYCDCSGDCADRARARGEEFRALLTTPPADTASTGADVEALALLMLRAYYDEPDETFAHHDRETYDDLARALLASDWLAAHDAATADRVRREVAEGIAAAIEAKYLGPNSGRGYDGRDGCRLKWIARRIARARSEGWDEGYRFALDNVSDPLVYADLTEYGTGWAGLIQRGGITIDINDQEKKP